MIIQETQTWLNRLCVLVAKGEIDNRTMANAIMARAEKSIDAGHPPEVVHMLQGEYRHAVRAHEKGLEARHVSN